MSHSPFRVGVVTRTRDRPAFVTRALKAVAAQSFTGWRLVLVNDGGDAGALDAALRAPEIGPMVDSGAVQVLHLPQSIGRSAAFNHGAAALDTEFVCCLDDDDTWDPEFLSALVTLYDRTVPLAPDLGGVATMVTAIREELLEEDGVATLVTLGEDDLPHAFKRRDFFIDPVAYATYRHDLYPVQWMLRRAEVLAVGGFPEAFSVMEDRAFMTRFLQRWRLAVLDRPLAFHHRRARRHGDTSQSVVLNTLDNPSYDWRLYSDLAKVAINSPPGDAGQHAGDASAEFRGSARRPEDRTAELIRAVAGTVIKELNDETSALWHKINGEAATLRARIQSLDARIGNVEAREEATAPAGARRWSLWNTVGDSEAGYPLGVGTPFLERLELSMPEAMPGLLLHASPMRRQMVVQIPRTGDWTALELSLAGLAGKGEGLRCELVVSHPDGFLFETALSLTTRDLLGRSSHAFDGHHVHACPPGGSVRISRDFAAAALARSDKPKLSIALPRQALNFRLLCDDLVVSQI